MSSHPSPPPNAFADRPDRAARAPRYGRLITLEPKRDQVFTTAVIGIDGGPGGRDALALGHQLASRVVAVETGGDVGDGLPRWPSPCGLGRGRPSAGPRGRRLGR